MSEMILVTTPSIPGYRVKRVLGVVHGMTARTRGVGGRFIASIQAAFGGEVSAFTMEMQKAKEEARKLGANAVVGIDFETTEVFQTVVLVSVHGTAVEVEREQD